MHNICGCNKPDCKLCKQQSVFLQGKAVRQEDRNFLQDGPKLDDSAVAFFGLPKEHASAQAFKPTDSIDEYLSSLPPERAKQAAVFF